MLQKLVEVRADGARRSKGIRSFEKFRGTRLINSSLEGSPRRRNFSSGPGLTRRVKHGFRLNAAVSKLVRRISIRLSSSSSLSFFIPRVSSCFSSSLLRKGRVCSFQTGGCSRGTEMGVNSDPIVQRQIRWRARVREISGGGRA